MSLDFVVAIPARFASSRLPGKPLRLIGGRPMIARVVERALLAGAREVVVATDDQRIAQALVDTAARVCLTRSDHLSGTDRLAEVAAQRGWPDATVVVNLQGDEPFAPPIGLRAVAELLVRAGTPMATLCTPIRDRAELFSPSVVKVVVDSQGHALYFSRAPIPFARDVFASAAGADAVTNASALPMPFEFWRHLGIYAYRAGFLRQFAALAPSPLEQIECLEQLRALSAGFGIAVAPSPELFPAGVDTEADLMRAEAWAATH